MHKINFYRDSKGHEPVYEYMQELAAKKDKDSRIKLNKIQEYIEVLSVNGKSAGESYIKHLEGDIWELRPLRDRILFVGWHDDGFVLLHSFVKKTQKTPRREIDKAQRELKDLIERGVSYE